MRWKLLIQYTIFVVSTWGVSGCNPPPRPRPPLPPPPPVNCTWTVWGQWGPCSMTCGGGSRSCDRVVDQLAQHGGDCLGDSTKEETCNEILCLPAVDCTWDNWSPWGPCTVTCGGGSQTSIRDIERHARNGGAPCLGESTKDQSCNNQTCFPLVNCTWGHWGPWQSCSVTCGEGVQTSMRDVDIPSQNGGSSCIGASEKERQCNDRKCVVTEGPVCPVGESADRTSLQYHVRRDKKRSKAGRGRQCP